MPQITARPCHCDLDTCCLCLRAKNDPRFQRHWGLPITATAQTAKALYAKLARAKTAGPRPAPLPACQHLREDTGKTVLCDSCVGKVELKLFTCGAHGCCTLGKRVKGIACCDSSCKERS